MSVGFGEPKIISPKDREVAYQEKYYNNADAQYYRSEISRLTTNLEELKRKYQKLQDENYDIRSESNNFRAKCTELERQIEQLKKKAALPYAKGAKLTPWMHRGDQHYFVKVDGDARGPRLCEIFRGDDNFGRKMWYARSNFLDLGRGKSITSSEEFRYLVDIISEMFETQLGFTASRALLNLNSKKTSRKWKKFDVSMKKAKRTSKKTGSTDKISEPPNKTKTEKEKGANTMEDEYCEAESTRDMFVSRVTHGGKVAVADEASEVLLMLVEGLVGEAYPEIARTERGKDFVKIVAALGLHYAATNYGEMIPQSDGVAEACGLVIEASARDVIQPELKKLQPILARLAAVGSASLTGAEE